MYLALWLMRRWRLPATPAFSLPDAVILKRFFTPDLVFSLGISRRGPKIPSSGRVDEPPWHALGPGGSEGAGTYAKGGGKARWWALCVAFATSPSAPRSPSPRTSRRPGGGRRRGRRGPASGL